MKFNGLMSVRQSGTISGTTSPVWPKFGTRVENVPARDIRYFLYSNSTPTGGYWYTNRIIFVDLRVTLTIRMKY